ncbi:uncharacterized protein PAC_17395 [Phialocephala subalpina]|uniref:DUF3533 domain-containing protein n=1 Tax=Phialocephala subalpina TaxID=576137 RepID=A0A1L7XR22_9HELO|nr:uncharacterized protein PAC_17395 [Phialocephala subalpina]
MERFGWRDPFWNGKRKPFVIATVMSGLLLILLFLGNLSYLYGSIYRDGSRVKGLNILAVNYDGGVIGQSLEAAYSSLRGDSFPTLHFQPATQYPTIDDVRNAVCKGDYWAAIIAQDGSSTRLAAALTGTETTTYNASNTLTYVYNGARYPTVQSGYIVANMETLIGTAGGVYDSINGTYAASTVDTSNANAVRALLNPITSSDIDIMPTNQGDRVLYNTVTMVLPIIQQFFFLMAVNGISNQFGIYGHLKTARVGTIRFLMAFIYTFLASLTVIGYIWAFRESWGINGNQFVLSWMVIWLYMHVNFLVLDTVTAFIPISFLTFFVLTWVILNITSTLFPFELSPGFYRWGYVLPAHNAITILFQIWSGGCNNQLSRALPVLFGWEVFGLAAGVMGVFYRNRQARKAVLKENGISEDGKTESGADTLRGSVYSTDNEKPSGPPGLPMPFANAVYERPKMRRRGTA